MKIEPAKNNPCIPPAAAVLIGSIVTGCEDQTAVGYVRPFFKDGEQQPASSRPLELPAELESAINGDSETK